MRKRVPAAVLAVLLAWGMAAPALATALLSDEYTSTGTFWQAVAEKWYFLPGSLIPSVIGWVCDDVCSESADHKHHGSLKTYEQNPDKSFTAVCSYCSAEFPVYDADLSAAYDDYVAELPATSYSSDGSLLFPVSFTIFRYRYSTGTFSYHDFYFSQPDSNSYRSSSASIYFLPSINTLRVSLSDGYSSFTLWGVSSYGYLEAPYDGYYQRISSPSASVHYVLSDGQTFDESKSYIAGASPLYFSAGSVVCSSSTSSSPALVSVGGSDKTNLFFAEAVFYPAYYKFTPAPSVDINFNTTYNTTTRPTSITGGNYGIIGDNGQITQVTDNSSIVNETNNTYYNPATGETSTITDWSYDYSDRSYNLTLEGGDTSTVTYGDENITITETTINESGDTIINNYTIYYIIEGSGSSTGPDIHTHDWRETSTTPATCTVPGSRLLTCSLCNQTKTETIPALGHTWQVKQSVTTQYDDTGQLIQQGYTIYQCAVCGEQYKSQDGTGPPGGSSDGGEEEGSGLLDKLGELLGSGAGGFLKLVAAFLGGILDGLIALVNVIVEKLGEVITAVNKIFLEVPQLFTGFLDFLAAIFPFLPPEITLLLTFGVAAVVFVGIIKAIRR